MRQRGIGERIRATRRRLGLSQEAFAKRVGIRKGSVARYEAGRVPRTDVLTRIAEVGRVSVELLFRGGGDGKAKREQDSPGEAALNAFVMQLRETLTPRIRQLSPPYRARYQARIKEALARLHRELDEFGRLLEAEHRREVGRDQRRR